MKMKNGCNLAENFRNCIKYRPALTVFTVGICLLGSALVYMSAYILTHDDILNKNVKTDWNVFVGDLKTIKWCTDRASGVKNSIPTMSPVGQTYSQKIAYVVSVNVSTGFIKTHKGQLVWYAYMKDLLPKEDLKEKKLSYKMVKVIIDFSQMNVPKKPQNNWLVGNSTLLLLSNYSIPDTPLQPQPKRLLVPSVDFPKISIVNETQIYKCEFNNSPLPLTFIHSDEPEYKVYFSENERVNIYLHLFSTSCFFFTTALIIVLYGLLKRRPTYEVPRSSETT